MKKVLLWLLGCAVMQTAAAEVWMPKFFGDHMVLQRGQPIRVWGRAAKNEAVTVRFGGAEAVVRADRTGRWAVELPAMEADAAGREMIVAGRDSELRFDDVLVGDVWLCCGQSNMEWPLDPTIGCEEEIASSANPNIRLLTVGRRIAFEEQEDIESGAWAECTPATSRTFSAVAYYFGKFVQAEIGIPVGLIHSSWGGTDIETWIGWEAMCTTADYAQYGGKRSPREAIGRNMKRFLDYKEARRNDRGDRERWYDPSVAVSGEWRTMKLPQLWENELGPADGRIWFRRTVTLPASVDGKAGVLHLPAVDDADITYVNGRKVGETHVWDAPRHYELPAGLLHGGDNIVAVRVDDTGNDGGIWGDPEAFWIEVDGGRYELAGEWRYRPSATTTMFGIIGNGDYDNPNSFASLLYNGMIRPLVGYGIRGAIWYQGENNAGRALSYRTLFPLMIRDWRAQWGSDFPFFWVQLANYMAIREQPGESAWAELREAQNMTLAVPATGQAVITDIGEAGDIHPRNKRDVGYRLSRAALKVAYGRDVAAGGPVCRSVEHRGDRIVLTFDAAGALCPVGGDRYGYLHGFSIAGADRRFVWAQAYVLENDKVVVFSDEVKEPVAVRYGWADNPQDNDLTDGSGLLASPFRTDDWPGVTR